MYPTQSLSPQKVSHLTLRLVMRLFSITGDSHPSLSFTNSSSARPTCSESSTPFFRSLNSSLQYLIDSRTVRYVHRASHRSTNEATRQKIPTAVPTLAVVKLKDNSPSAKFSYL